MLPDGQASAAVAAAIIADRGRVLLVRRRVAEGPLWWQFPAGKVEPGEAPAAAAVREADEEVGLIVEVDQVLGFRKHPVTHQEMAYVACTITAGVAHVAAPAEIDTIQWCSTDRIESRLPAGVFPPVLAYLRGLG